MALDKNLFTLNLEPSKIEPTALDLVDPSGTVHYRKRWVPNEAGTYLFALLDPLSDSVLATAAAPTATSKEKVIELHNPSVTVPLAFKGTLTFKWCFVWEEHEFEWKREACYMIRKPDPPVLVAVTKEPAGRIKTSTVQILDYNLNRFDVEDRKGFEVVLLTSLLTFGDQSDQLRAKSGDASSTPSISPAASVAPPPAPPKPEGWTGDQIAILQAKEQRDVNEVVIGEAGDVNEYAKHCVALLEDDALLFITLRSLSPESVSKVVQVAEATKRTRYKSGAYDEELHQYVDMSVGEVPSAPGQNGKAKGKGKPPRVINLDDRPASAPTPAAGSTYRPPNTLTIHLSKIAMPELQPKAKKGHQARDGSPPHSKTASSDSHSHSKAASEPRPKPSKDGHGKQGSANPATLTKPRPASPPSQPTGLRAKLAAFASRSSSPPPSSRPASAPQPPSPPSQSAPAQPHSRPPSHTPRPSQSTGHSPSHSQQQPHPQQQPAQYPPPPHLQHAHSHPPHGPGPYFNPHAPGPGSMPPNPASPRPRPQSNIYAPQGGYAPLPPGPLNAAPRPPNAAYAMYPSFAGAPAPPPPPQASGAGFLDRLVRR